MATREEFCNAMEDVYKNHGVYIGTANGELTESLTIGKIHQMEINYGRANPDNDTKRDLNFIAKCYENHFDMSRSKAGDCSGIIVGELRRLGVISKSADYSAKMFQKKAVTVSLKDLQPADLVFNKTTDASHVGVYVGNGYVIESMGRDTGVVKRKTSEGPWVIGGRLEWFDDDIPVLTRNLRYIEDNLMRGEDVRMCQEQLKKKGYDCGKADGVFGIKTRDCVILFQANNGLNADGIVGQKTWNKLFEM